MPHSLRRQNFSLFYKTWQNRYNHQPRMGTHHRKYCAKRHTTAWKTAQSPLLSALSSLSCSVSSGDENSNLTVKALSWAILVRTHYSAAPGSLRNENAKHARPILNSHAQGSQGTQVLHISWVAGKGHRKNKKGQGRLGTCLESECVLQSTADPRKRWKPCWT